MVEVQYHPADVARPPRFFFFREAWVRAIWVGGTLALFLLVWGLSLVPGAISGVVVWVKVQKLVGERKALVKRQQVLYGELEDLRKKTGEATQKLRRYALILGTNSGEWEVLSREEDLPTAAGRLVAGVERLLHWAEDHGELVASLPAITPLPPGKMEVSSPFGGRVSPFTGAWEMHKGIDLAAEEGLPVRATGKGVVVFAGRAGMENPTWARLGNAVAIHHSGLYLTIYAHLRRVLVKEGQKVARGDLVGEVGSTGWSTAPHLHYEVRRITDGENAVPVDPRFFMLDYPWGQEGRAVGGEGTPALDLLPAEKEILPWLKTKRFPR
ncbi:MAG: M23 family metallopeptidase [Thermoanaerobaculaceae bacterium]